ncbi:MAG: zinc-binding dehydrogenase [Nitrososphaerales archaeon]
MKATVIHEHGGADKLSYEDIEDPKPAKDEVLVKVKTCAVNHLDIFVRQGLPGRTLKFPHILGCDIAGEIGSKNSKFPIGSRVIVHPGLSCGKCSYCKKAKENLCSEFSILGGFSDVQGGYAEYVRVPLRNILKIPSWFSYDEAACLGVSYLVSWNMLKSTKVGKGTTLLVYGAGSGVGSAAIQLARAMGAQVITTIGDDGKATLAKQLGARHVINRTRDDIVTEVKTLTGNGVDVVIDHVGASTWMASVKCLKLGGRMAVCGATTGETVNVEIRAVYNKQLSIIGAYSGTKPQLVELMAFMRSKKIKPIIDSTFKLNKASDAHKRMERSEHFGKILLKIQN